MFDFNSTRPDWSVDGRDWPNRESSQFVRVGAIHWHVQIAGPESAPAILMLHGTGAASHSYRDMLPLLARSFRVIVPDLPGHGFTDARSTTALSLPGMAKSLSALCKTLGIEPSYCVGHSAGAAVLLQMALSDGRVVCADHRDQQRAEADRRQRDLVTIGKAIFRQPFDSQDRFVARSQWRDGRIASPHGQDRHSVITAFSSTAHSCATRLMWRGHWA